MIFGRKATLTILIGLAAFIWYAVFQNSGGELDVYFLDVGQGDSILIETPHGHQALIDGGPSAVVIRRLAEVMPFYDKSLDLVMATHSDLDHLAGLIEVLKHYEVSLVVENGLEADTALYQEWQELLLKKAIRPKTVRLGDRILFDQNVSLDILGPFEEDFRPLPEKPNEVMIVSRLIFGENEFLFTGDLEKGDEIRLATSNLPLRSDVLKVPHHGSKYSSSQLFLEKVQPSYTVISAGRRNRYGHPHEETLERLGAIGAKIFQTNRDGTIIIKSNGQALLVVK